MVSVKTFSIACCELYYAFFVRQREYGNNQIQLISQQYVQYIVQCGMSVLFSKA